MVDAPISRARIRDPARLDRYPPGSGTLRRPARAGRFATSGLADAASSAFTLPSRPRAAGSRPEGGDFMASTI